MLQSVVLVVLNALCGDSDTTHNHCYKTQASHVVVHVLPQGRVCNGSHKAARTGTGVGPGAAGSVSVRPEEPASPTGAAEPAEGPAHLQQSLLCTAELGLPQVTVTAHYTGQSKVDLSVGYNSIVQLVQWFIVKKKTAVCMM